MDAYELEHAARKLERLTDDAILSVFSNLNVGVGDSRRAWNCEGGTEVFVRGIRREYEYKYGTPCRAKYLPLGTLLPLYREGRKHGRLMNQTQYFRQAIAAAIIRKGRLAELQRLGW